MGLKEFLKNCKRVLKIAKKPGKEEFYSATKITGLGIVFIGLIGFIVFLVFRLLLGGIL
jgi:protein transport protein SEC61 subunit gamma-like protein